VRRLWGLAAAVAAAVTAACVDLSAPAGQPGSISQLQLGAFFVVHGDVMRDTLGDPVKPSIIAFDGAGNPISGFTPLFFTTDSVGALRLDSDGFLVARDTVNATSPVHGTIVGQIGSLQTQPQTVWVTVAPTTLARAKVELDSILVPGSQQLDSASSIGTVALPVMVFGDGNVPVPGMFVRYTLETNVPSNGDSPAVYLRDDANNVFPAGQSTADTADASATVSRTLVVNSKFVASLSSLLSDTLVVVATARYRGTPLTPLRILVPVRARF
jgi:hypothetical protein